MGKTARAVARPFAPIQSVGEIKGLPGTVKNWANEGGKFLGVGKPYQPDAGAFAPNAQEQEYIGKLQDMAYGKVPSAAEMQMKQGLGQATSQASALAASARGLSPALAQRLAQMQQAGMMQNVNQNSGILRAQEQANSMGMLGNEMQSVRTGKMGAEGLKANVFENSQQRRTSLGSGVLQGGAMGLMMAARGGQVPGYLDGGRIEAVPSAEYISAPSASQFDGLPAEGSASPANKKHMMPMQTPQAQSSQAMQMPNVMTIQPHQSASMIGQKLGLAGGGGVPMSTGGDMLAQSGGHVPGQAAVQGDSPKNDTVPAMLSPGEIVIPRSILDHEHAGEMAKSFVEGILAGGGGKKKDSFSGGGIMDKYFAEEDAKDKPNTVSIEKGFTPAPGVTAAGALASPITLKAAPQPGIPEPEMPTDQPMPQPQAMPQQMPSGKAGGSFDYGLKPAEQGLKDINYDVNQEILNHKLDTEKFAQEAGEGKIDPNHYLNSMSTGQKVKTAIALMIGGMAGGLGGRPNAVSEYINNQIDRDIKGQEANMTQKNNLFKMNNEIFRDKMDAYSKSKADLLALAEFHVKNQDLSGASPMGQMAQQKLALELEQLRMQNLQSMAQRKAMQMAIQGGNQGDPSSLVSLMVPKEHQAKAYEEIKTAEDLSTAHGKAVGAYHDLISQLKNPKNLAGYIEPEAQNRLEAVIVPTIQKIEGTTREFAFDSAKRNFIPNARDILFGRDKGKLKALEDYFTSHASAPVTRGNHIDLSKFKSTAHPMDFSSMEGAPKRK